jgi:AcrR family transcriptional regulator
MSSDGGAVKAGRTRAYHHGRLREALLEGALAMAQEGGPDAVGLREAARRAGVSPTAAYRHFADRDALLGAVRDAASDELSARMRAELETADGSATQTLRATGSAYVRFAIDEPGLFRTAFASCTAAPQPRTPEELPYVLLGKALDGLVAEGLMPAARRAGAEEVAWACVHGVARLVLEGELPPAVGDAIRERAAGSLLERVLDLVRDGLTAPAQ